MHSTRLLPFDNNQKFVISGWFATMGYGLPAAMAAKLENPNKQVWSISGDGGYSMNMQEILTQTQYQLPIINIVISNQQFGFIRHAQLNDNFAYGVDLIDGDWALTARGMGAISYTVHTIDELKQALAEIDELQKNGNKRPVFIDAKVIYRDPIDTAAMIMEPSIYSEEEINQFKERYNVFGMPPFSELSTK